MINLRFYLRTDVKSKDSLCQVFADISYNGNRIRVPVPDVKTRESHWAIRERRVKRPGKGEPYNFFNEFNLKLSAFENSISEIKRTVLLNNSRLSNKFILERLKNPNKLKADKREFSAVVAEYLEVSKSIKAKNTIKGRVSVFRFLQEFQRSSNIQLNFEELNQSFFERLRRYAFEEKKIGDNYFAKIIASLKSFLTWAHDLGYHSNLAYKKFRATERETEVVYLTIEELFKLYNYAFDSKKLDQVRDFYCFGCFTGLRFSDMVGLKPAHIQGDFIIKTIQKTQETDSKIPLSIYAKEILGKYYDTVHEPLPRVSHQKFNDYIKECCKVVGIDSPTTRVRFSGSSRIENTYPKWQLITSHTARKTFVTNSLILGMKEMVIRNITGHKKEENFKRYVRIADNVKQHEVARTWNKIQEELHKAV